MIDNFDSARTMTRQERYKNKKGTKLPVSVCATNFTQHENLAYLSRALACFGGEDLHVIGKIPSDSDMKRFSGGHSTLVNIIQHSTPVDFISHCKDNKISIISIELESGAKPVSDMTFVKDQNVCFVVGNEMNGVPVEIIKASDQLVYIPMPGKGFCLNTAQAGNVILYEYSRRFTHV